jgi:threonine dehydratase
VVSGGNVDPALLAEVLTEKTVDSGQWTVDSEQ